MIEYAIIAISFAFMVLFRYTFEVIATVNQLKIALDIEDEPHRFSATWFSIFFFLYNVVAMPLMAVYIFIADRETVVKDITRAILKSYFELEEK